MGKEANGEKPAHVSVMNYYLSCKVTRESSCCPSVDELDMASAVESDRELPLKPHSFWEKGAITTDLPCQTEMATHGCGQKSNF